MSTPKKFLYHFVGLLFKICLVVLPVVFAVTLVFGSPDSIEKALKESRVYDQFVTVVLDSSKEQATEPGAQQLLNDPGIRAAIEESFPAELLERSTTTVIGGVFAWLQGDTPEPQFVVDFTEAKTSLITNLKEVAEKRAAGLPECTVEQLQTLDPNTDFLSLPCRPPGFDVKQASDQFGQQILHDVEFLNKPVISHQTLAKEGQPLISEDLQQLPKAYQAAQAAKWVALAIVTGLGLVLVFARHDRRAGLRHIAWAMLGAGVFLGITLAVYWFAFDQANKTVAGVDATRAMVLDGAQVLMTDLNQIILMFSGAYMLVGGGILLTLRLRTPKTTGKVSDEPAVTDTKKHPKPAEGVDAEAPTSSDKIT